MKKVLIINYYWPPSGGSGVQRWLNFVRYLRLFGWEPVVYTVSNGEYPYLDKGLEELVPESVEVIKRPIWEPYQWFRRLSRRKTQIDPTIFGQSGKPSFIGRLGLWVRANCFIPDPRVFWVNSSVRFLKTYLKLHPVDLIVSTGPPHSMHLIACKLRKVTGVKWLADFRDPWTQLFFYKSLPLTPLARKIHQRLERKVLKTADAVVTVSPHCKMGLMDQLNREVQVITNGYEPFPKPAHVPKNESIIMLYTGVLTADRNPVLLWQQLSLYLSEHQSFAEKFELIFVGNIDPEVIVSAKENGITKVQTFAPMPHADLQSYLWRADCLLLIGVPDEKGVVTGKFFEYLYVNKPILCISPEGSDLEVLIRETNSGCHADFMDGQGIAVAISETMRQMNGEFQPERSKIENFSRKNLTRQLAKLMDAMIG